MTANSANSAMWDVSPATLYWSRRGRIACEHHAPAPLSPDWSAEGWRRIPPEAYRHRIVYQCEACTGRAIGRRATASSVMVSAREDGAA